MQPGAAQAVTTFQVDCNWLQMLEGDLDTSHLACLHLGGVSADWGPKPQWAHIIETLVPEEATRVALLERGDLDIIGSLSFDRMVELKNKGFRLQEVGLPILANISLPGTFLTRRPASDVRVRQALSYSINRQEISDTFYKGLANPGGWWFWSEQTWGFDRAQWTADPYDPDKAKQLLSHAGYPAKFNSQMIELYTNAVNADLMQILQGYWQAVGLNVDVQVVDSPIWLQMFFVRGYPDDRMVWAIIPWLSSGFLNNVYHTANLLTSTGTTTTGNDPKADQMYQAAVSELDDAKAKQLWQQLMHHGYDTMWVNIELVEVPSYFVVGKNVGAFTVKSNLSLWDAYVAFGVSQARGAQPMLPLHLFRPRPVAIPIGVGFAFTVGFYGLVFLFSLYLQELRGLSPLTTGLSFVSMTALGAFVTLIAPRLAARFGPRVPIAGGQLLMVVGLASLVIAVGIHAPVLLLVGLTVPVGAGSAMTIPTITALLVGSVPVERAGLQVVR